MHSSLVVRRAVVAVLAALSVLVAGLGGGLVTSAAAAPAAPDGLSPDGTTVDGIPVLQWNRVRDAVRYDVEVSASDSFSNTAVVDDHVQPPGDPHGAAPRGSPSTGGSAASVATGRAPGAAPATRAPPSAAPRRSRPPTAPCSTPRPSPRCCPGSRGAAPSATRSRSAPTRSSSTPRRCARYRTQTSSFVVPDPVVATDYYWRVRADLGTGVVTQWSPVRRYRMAGLDRPVLQSPLDSATTSVVDVVLDWEPVMGARAYNLQISTDRNFNTVDHTANGVIASRYSPPVTLNNDQYYWRVAPVDVEGNTLDWADVDVWEFRRHWPDQPSLQYPADNATVGNPFFFQWTPVRNASHYRLEISTSREFTDAGALRHLRHGQHHLRAQGGRRLPSRHPRHLLLAGRGAGPAPWGRRRRHQRAGPPVHLQPGHRRADRADAREHGHPPDAAVGPGPRRHVVRRRADPGQQRAGPRRPDDRDVVDTARAARPGRGLPLAGAERHLLRPGSVPGCCRSRSRGSPPPHRRRPPPAPRSW